MRYVFQSFFVDNEIYLNVCASKRFYIDFPITDFQYYFILCIEMSEFFPSIISRHRAQMLSESFSLFVTMQFEVSTSANQGIIVRPVHRAAARNRVVVT